MLVQRRVLRWRRVWKSFQAVSSNGFIFSFTLLLALKLDHLLFHSWWFAFTPFWWLCHAVISRGRFSLPSPPMPHDENWTPFQYVMATPLLVSFEILLFVYLEDKYGGDLKFVFIPLLVFEVAILVDNLRKCLTLMPRSEETMSDEPLLHTWVSIWMVSFIGAIIFTLVESRGDLAALELWELSINFGIAELFGFLVTKWRYQSIHRDSHISRSFSREIINRDEEDGNRECGFLDIGGYVMKIPFIIIQIILLMSLEGTSTSPKAIPIVVLFVPLLLLQGAVVIFVTYNSVVKSVLWIYNVGGPYGRYLARSSACVFMRFLKHCKRLLGCWSINEGSKEEQARLHSGEATGYNTFSPKAALSEQTDSSRQKKNLCIVCFDDPVNVVLFPCRHLVLCRDDAYVGTKLLGLYGRFELMEMAGRVFEDMPLKSLVTWNHMMSLFGRRGFLRECMFLFRELVGTGECLSESSFLGVLSSVSCENDLEASRQLHCSAKKIGLDCEIPIINSLISQYGRCGNTYMAERVLEEAVSCDIVSWNAVIGATNPFKALRHFEYARA